MKQQLSTASSCGEACEMLRSGYVKHVRLDWNVGSDEFFRIASDWCENKKKMEIVLLFLSKGSQSPASINLPVILRAAGALAALLHPSHLLK